MDRREWIVIDPKVLAGKPVVKGTRIAARGVADSCAITTQRCA
jgi:uncharacterized protein (DUF433 family)